MLTYLFFALVACCITYFLTPLVIRFAKQYKLVDDPRIRPHPAHIHNRTIPRAGGLALLFGIVLPIVIFLPQSKILLGIIAASFLTVIIGLFDDRKDLSPYIRFLANIVTATIVVLAGAGIPYITNPFGAGVVPLTQWIVSFNILGTHTIVVLADILAIIWIVWTMNIVGWSSGVDGQMPGFVAITAAVLGMLSLRFSAHDVSQQIVAGLAFITMGAFIGFIPWNFYPQKIMPGYGGKSLAGLLIATIAIFSGGKVGSALLVLAIPMIDAVFILIRRIIKGKSPFKADRNHLHHYLLDLGWSKRRIALFYWTVSLILGIITLTVNSTQKLFVFVMAGVIIVGMLLWLSTIVPNWPYPPDED